jgi:Protein of unknown function (DUF4232)
MTSTSKPAARLLAVAVAGCCAVLATACTSASQPAATSTTGPAASGAAAAQPSSSAQAGPPACATSALHASLPATANAASGHFYYPLSLSNDSGAPCTLYGYPGVSFVSSPGGSQIGAAATRATSAYTFRDQPPQTVTLAPGQTVHASMQLITAGVFPASQCGLVTANWVRVYPPNQTAPLYISFTAQTCSKGQTLLTVGPVQPVGTPAP